MIVCVARSPAFALLRRRSGTPRELLSRPLALAPEPGGPQVVGEVSGPAEAFGVRAGMRLGEALARCPELVLVPPDPERAEAAWEEVLRRLEGIGAAVESERPGRGVLRGGGPAGAVGRAPRGGPARGRGGRSAPRPARRGPTRLCAYAAARRARPRRAPVIVAEAGARVPRAAAGRALLRVASGRAAPRRAASGAIVPWTCRRRWSGSGSHAGRARGAADAAVADRFGARGPEGAAAGARRGRAAAPAPAPRGAGRSARAARGGLGPAARAGAGAAGRSPARPPGAARAEPAPAAARRAAGRGRGLAVGGRRCASASADAERLRLALLPKLEQLPGPAARSSLRALELGPAGERAGDAGTRPRRSGGASGSPRRCARRGRPRARRGAAGARGGPRLAGARAASHADPFPSPTTLVTARRHIYWPLPVEVEARRGRRAARRRGGRGRGGAGGVAGRGPLVDAAAASPPLLRARARRRARRGRLLRAGGAAAGSSSGHERAATSSCTAHSAYSFLDGASSPAELAASGGGARLPGAGAHRPRRGLGRDGVRAGLQGARGAPDLGAELTVDRRHGRPLPPDAAGRDRGRVAQSLPAAHRGPPRDAPAARIASPSPPPLRSTARASTPRGWSACPAALARGAGAGARGAVATVAARRGGRGAGAPAAAPSAPTASGSSCSGRSGATTGRATAGWPGSRSGSASPAWRPATSTRTTPRARRSRTRWSRCGCGRRSRRPSRSGAATRLGVSRRAGGDGGALRASTPRRSRRARGSPSGCGFDLTRDLGYRYPGSEDPGADRTLAEICRARLEHRYAGGRERARGAAAAGGGAGGDPLAAALGLLPAPLRHARAGARGGGRGARAGLRAGAAAAGARARLERQLDRLLPDRALAHRPGAQRAVPRALPERGDHRGARHRPRLPARHPREADPARARALRRASARRWSRRSPAIARAARCATSARRWGCRRARSSGWRGRSTCTTRPDSVESDMARGDRRASGPRRRAGGRWPGWPARLGAAAPPLPAPRRDGDLDPAAGRHLPGAAGGDGGAPDRPVGQGLVRRRRLSEDRPAGAGDAVGGRALRRRDRARARRADRPLADPARRRGDLPDDPGGGHDRRLPDREPGADADAAAHAAGEPRRPHGAGGAGAPGADPGRRRASLHRAAQAAARGSRLRGALRAPVAGADPARHAGGDRLPGAGDPGGDGAGRVQRRRGGGAAPGDEPQALGGGDPRLRRAVHRRGDGARGVDRRWRSGSSGRSRASRGSGSRRRTRPPSACSPTSRPGCGSTTAPSSSARC